MTQDEIFYEKEGNAWFKRNKDAAIKDIQRIKAANTLKIITLFGLNPKKVLDIGASNGLMISLIHEKFACQCTVAEPSQEAIEDGRKKFPFVDFHRATANKLPFNNAEFDLIIINYVFHWIDRKNLIKSAAEIDRVLSDKGLIVLTDFFPDCPKKVKYHHLPDEDVWTFKQDYSKIFMDSNMYRIIGVIEGDEKASINIENDENRRTATFLLQKNQNLYTFSDKQKFNKLSVKCQSNVVEQN